MIDIVCFKWGDKFGPAYVNRLAEAIERHVTVPHRFICYTDNSYGVKCETRPFLTDLPYWWYIIGLTNPDHDHSEKTIYMDLDTVITSNIDDIVSLDVPFATISDFYAPNGLQTAYIMWNKEVGAKIWNFFQSKYKPEDYKDLCRSAVGGTNQFLEECMGVRRLNRSPNAGVPGVAVNRLQEHFPGTCISYKCHVVKNNWDQLPDKTKMVFFHGEPMPHQVTTDWMNEHWRGVVR